MRCDDRERLGRPGDRRPRSDSDRPRARAPPAARDTTIRQPPRDERGPYGMVAFGMPERLTRADVDRIAALARLELSDAEKDLFVHQLSHVLEYAEQIQQIDTSGVPPTSQVLSHMPADRADERRPGSDERGGAGQRARPLSADRTLPRAAGRIGVSDREPSGTSLLSDSPRNS